MQCDMNDQCYSYYDIKLISVDNHSRWYKRLWYFSFMPYGRGGTQGVAEPLAPPLPQLKCGQCAGRGRPSEGTRKGTGKAKVEGLCHILLYLHYFDIPCNVRLLLSRSL